MTFIYRLKPMLETASRIHSANGGVRASQARIDDPVAFTDSARVSGAIYIVFFCCCLSKWPWVNGKEVLEKRKSIDTSTSLGGIWWSGTRKIETLILSLGAGSLVVWPRKITILLSSVPSFSQFSNGHRSSFKASQSFIYLVAIHTIALSCADLSLPISPCRQSRPSNTRSGSEAEKPPR